MTAAWAIALLILSPLAAAALAFAFPRRGRWLALATALMVGVAIVQLTRQVLADGVQVHRIGGWGPPLGIDQRADGLSVLMLLITALIGLMVLLYAQRYFTAHEPERSLTPGLWFDGGENSPSQGSRLEPLNHAGAASPSPPDAEGRRGPGRGGSELAGQPLSPALSPLVPRGERETRRPRSIQAHGKPPRPKDAHSDNEPGAEAWSPGFSRSDAPKPPEGGTTNKPVHGKEENTHRRNALHRERYFWPLFLFLWTALNGLFLSADLFNLCVTLELLGFAAVTMVALASQREALTAAMRYLFVGLSGSLFYLLGVALVYGQCATVDLSALAAKAPSGPTLWVALALMTNEIAPCAMTTTKSSDAQESLLHRHWHHLPTSEVIQLLETNSESGLDRFALNHRQAEFGPNQLTPRKGRSPWMRFLLQFHNPLIYILLAAGVIKLVMGGFVDAAVILGVVFINAWVGYLQEAKAERAIEALAKSLVTESTVMRAGKTVRVPSTQLVPGDVVLLASGDKVPADLRLVATRDLQVAEAALTGESTSVEKTAEAQLAPETLLADRAHMAYASTLVTYGQGRGVVVATGDHTEIGRISEMISAAPSLETPLTRKMAAFSYKLLILILGLAALVLAVGWVRGERLEEIVSSAIALAVGAIPEGLPATVTVTLAIGVARMAKRRAIIRKLPAVETLGSTTVICSDKTGTLTQNQMTVRQVVVGDSVVEVGGNGDEPEGDLTLDGKRLTPGEAPGSFGVSAGWAALQ